MLHSLEELKVVFGNECSDSDLRYLELCCYLSTVKTPMSLLLDTPLHLSPEYLTKEQILSIIRDYANNCNFVINKTVADIGHTNFAKLLCNASNCDKNLLLRL